MHLVGLICKNTTNVSATVSTGGQYSRSLMIRFEAKALLKLQDFGLNYILMCATTEVKGESSILITYSFSRPSNFNSRSRCPCGLRLTSEAVWFQVSWVRTPLRAWMFVCCVCCVGSGLCDRLITHSECPSGCVCLIVCGVETSTRRPIRDRRCCATERERERNLNSS